MPTPIITPCIARDAPAEAWSLPRYLRLDVDEAQELEELWAMSAAERVAAMWRGQLSLYQLCKWSSRAPDEVPLIGGELAWIVIRTPEWLGDSERQPEWR